MPQTWEACHPVAPGELQGNGVRGGPCCSQARRKQGSDPNTASPPALPLGNGLLPSGPPPQSALMRKMPSAERSLRAEGRGGIRQQVPKQKVAPGPHAPLAENSGDKKERMLGHPGLPPWSAWP